MCPLYRARPAGKTGPKVPSGTVRGPDNDPGTNGTKDLSLGRLVTLMPAWPTGVEWRRQTTTRTETTRRGRDEGKDVRLPR
jgi:hypothetical protein